MPLFDGVNDSLRKRKKLADIIQDLNCHVNRISANNVANQKMQPSPRAVYGLSAGIKKPRNQLYTEAESGTGHRCGCGQLRSRFFNVKKQMTKRIYIE